MRFTLVDKITSLQPGESITTVKNLSLAEEYLADHFPGFPVMPGVLMLEAMVQASAWLIRSTEDFAHSIILLRKARAVKFNSFVTPGNSLIINVQLQKEDGNTVTLKSKGTVDGRSTVSARLTLEKFNLADKNPDLAKADEHCVRKLRETYADLWKPSEQA
jgi:3-hydroxyacyl-[acyl-carrier-protein] dehydratase